MMRFPNRGGNWNNGSNAGLGMTNLNNERSNTNSNIGFRPAPDNTARNTDLKGSCQCQFQKDAKAPAKAEKQIRPLDASGECLYDQLVNFDSFLAAAYQCRKNKAQKNSTLRFFDRLEENIIDITNELSWQTYHASPYHQFYVFEPKRRLISAPNFRDRVVHRAIYNIIEPLFDRQFEHDSYACRTGKGTHAGASRAQKFIRQVESRHGKAYAFKADISRYFSSIDHGVLKSLIEAKLRCERMKALLFYIIDTNPTGEVGKGIPLGNLTSQLFANLYLHELDRYAKHTLREKRYIRYMDDFVFIHEDKAHLQDIRVKVEKFLSGSLLLKTNSKTQVFPIGAGKGRALDFLGFRIYSTHRLLRKCSAKRIKTTLKKLHKKYAAGILGFDDVNQKLQSWLGHSSHANTFGLRVSLFKKPFERSK